MIDLHKKEGKLKISTFLEELKKYKKEDIESTAHTFFRISQKQRKIYTEKELREIILNSRPTEIVVQKNNNYAVIYRYKKGFIKIILDFSTNKVYIVTFYILNEQQRKEIGK